MDDETNDPFEDLFDDGDDETDSELGGMMGLAMNNMFGTSLSDSPVDLSEEAQLSVDMMKAASVLSDVAAYVDENDITQEDLNETQMEVMDADVDELQFQQSLVVLFQAMGELAENFEDDDDDENPYRVK